MVAVETPVAVTRPYVAERYGSVDEHEHKINIPFLCPVRKQNKWNMQCARACTSSIATYFQNAFRDKLITDCAYKL